MNHLPRPSRRTRERVVGWHIDVPPPNGMRIGSTQRIFYVQVFNIIETLRDIVLDFLSTVPKITSRHSKTILPHLGVADWDLPQAKI